MFSSTFCNEMFSFIFRNQKCGKLEAFSSDCMKHSLKKSRDYLSFMQKSSVYNGRQKFGDIFCVPSPCGK